jgi:hydrogenase 3 maturation protease
MSETSGLAEELQSRLHGKVLIIGAGNSLRGDDGAGPAFITLLEGQTGAVLIDAGDAPESCTGKVLSAAPDAIVFVDAANFGGSPGDVIVLEPDDMAGCAISTHQMPLNLFFQYLRGNCSADILGLGIQPAQIEFGESMNSAVVESIEALAHIFKELLPPSGERSMQVNDE